MDTGKVPQCPGTGTKFRIHKITLDDTPLDQPLSCPKNWDHFKLSRMRKIAINLVGVDETQKGSPKGHHQVAGWYNGYMQEVIGL
jgi:hypothetical protein